MSDYPPRGLFEGRNFMTPNIISYRNLGLGQWAELSSGSGFRPGSTWYGVSVRPDPDKQSKGPFYTRREAEDYMDSLTEDKET